MMRKIAFAAPAGSGKDYITDVLISAFNCRKFAFADPLKEASKYLFDILELNPSQEVKNDIIPKYNMSHRDIWIKLSKTIREIDDTIWVDKTVSKINSYIEEESGIAIISDLRTVLEFEVLKSQGFTTFWIEREGLNVFSEYDINNTMKLKSLCDYTYNNKIGCTNEEILHWFSSVLRG
jgi:hypothetical protein